MGISRAPLGSQIKIPSVRDEENLLARLPVVPDEVDRSAPAEVDDPEEVVVSED